MSHYDFARQLLRSATLNFISSIANMPLNILAI